MSGFNWDLERRRTSGASMDEPQTYYNENVVVADGQPLMVVEWSDGLVLGVIPLEGQRYFMRYHRSLKRWQPITEFWQLDRVRPVWQEHRDAILAGRPWGT